MPPRKMCARNFSKKTVIIDNAGTVTLWILGLYLLFLLNVWFVIIYAIYIPISVLWFWRFICTYCTHYGTNCCPCGYARGASKLFLFRDETKFKQAFHRNIAIAFPYWFVPLLAGLYLIYNAYPDVSSTLWIVYIATMVDGFVIVPVVSKTVGCKECPTRDSCPWAEDRSKAGKRHF